MDDSNLSEAGASPNAHREPTMDVEMQDSTPCPVNGRARTPDRSISPESIAIAIGHGPAGAQIGAGGANHSPAAGLVPIVREAPGHPPYNPTPAEQAADRNFFLTFFTANGSMRVAVNNLRYQIGVMKIMSGTVSPIRSMIGVMISNEDTEYPVTVHVLLENHWDRLLDEIMAKSKTLARMSPILADLVSQASKIQYMLCMRLKQAYFNISSIRFRAMKSQGRFYGLVPVDRDEPTEHIWHVPSPNRPTSAPELKLGSWWFNPECLFRDGIVDSSEERVTTRGDVFVLPLLSGREHRGFEPDTVVIKKSGKMRELYPTLMEHGGRRVRVFRGYKLRSEFAPKAGIRYDGEYTVVSYGHHLVSQNSRVFSLVLVLRPTMHHLTLHEMESMPTASECDEWQLYHAILFYEISARFGIEAYMRWSEGEMRREIEKADWVKDQVRHDKFINRAYLGMYRW